MGCDDAWEQRKLGDLTKRVTRKNQQLKTNLPLTISSLYGLIRQDNFFNGTVASKDLSGYYLIKRGEFAYNKSTSNDSPWGAIKQLTDYDCGALSTLYIVFKVNNVNSLFLQQLFNSSVWHRGIFQIATEGARNHGLLNISAGDFFNLLLYVPTTREEQSCIEKILNKLGKIIALHERKVKALERLKIGFLQQLFPEKGRITPRLRFIGFKDEWKQCKSGRIFKSISQKGFSDMPVLSATQEDGMVPRGSVGIDIKYDKASLYNYKLVQPGQFVIHLRSFQGGFAYARMSGITSPTYTVIGFKDSKNQIPEFWIDPLRSQDFIQRLKTVTYGIRDGRSISFKDFSTLKLSFPEKNEQTKIAALLSKLNRAIAINKSLCKTFESLKQAFLQQLLV